MNIIYKNNKRLLKSDLHIALDDRSFRFGDGCFETIPFFAKKCLGLDAHLMRLKQSLEALKIKLDLSTISAQVATLLAEADYADGICRIICSRGEGSHGFLPSKHAEAYYIIECAENSAKPPSNVRLYISTIQRFSAKVMPVRAKLNNGLNSILARLEAEENNCTEALLLDEFGKIAEGSSSNICAKIDGQFCFAKSESKLNGITELIMKECFPKHKEIELSLDDLKTASSIYIMNSGFGVLVVDSIPQLHLNFKKTDSDAFIAAYAAQIRKL